MDKSKIVAVVGPTASGKTALAIKIAKRFNGEIISADSMQIYKEMSIASAKPDESEMQGIKHHLLDCVEPDERFSVADFVVMAKQCAEEIISDNKLPVICGGTGLYIDSFLNNISFADNGFDEEIRNNLLSRLENEGIVPLYNELCEVDRAYAESIDKNNTKRVLRALELYLSSGIKMSEQLKESRKNEPLYDVLYLGINYKSRDILYDRINRRVDEMVERGLFEEAKQFYNNYGLKTSSQAIGIKELEPYINLESPPKEAIDRIKQVTRNYAKRQITWFKRNPDIFWLYPDETDDIISLAFDKTEEFLGGLK